MRSINSPEADKNREDQDLMPGKEESPMRAEGTVADKMLSQLPTGTRHIVTNTGYTQAGTATQVTRAQGPHEGRHTGLQTDTHMHASEGKREGL